MRVRIVDTPAGMWLETEKKKPLNGIVVLAIRKKLNPQQMFWQGERINQFGMQEIEVVVSPYRPAGIATVGSHDFLQWEDHTLENIRIVHKQICLPNVFVTFEILAHDYRMRLEKTAPKL